MVIFKGYNIPSGVTDDMLEKIILILRNGLTNPTTTHETRRGSMMRELHASSYPTLLQYNQLCENAWAVHIESES